MKLHPLMLLAGVLALPSPLRAGPELDPLRAIAIQDGGRVKPFDTFARETARRVSGATPFTGGESVKGMDPVEWILSMLSDPQRWRDERIVKVSHAGLRAAAGLPPRADQRYSFAELTTHAGFLAAADKVHEKLRQDREAKLDPVEREISTLYDTLGVMNGLFSGESLRIVPHPTDKNAAWFSLPTWTAWTRLPSSGSRR